MLDSYDEAKEKFLSGDYSVSEFFNQNGYVLEYAYCKLLSGDAQGAKVEFAKTAKNDFRADWGMKLIQFIEGYVENTPTYFQIRDFLEIDLNLLLQAKQPDYVENIINGADIFYSINPESYKFISRVMLNNDFAEVALYYLKKAKDKFYYDPEMHYMLANCYVRQGETQLAKDSLKNCLDILPEYFPAKKLLQSIS
jgi:hypothetical protein